MLDLVLALSLTTLFYSTLSPKLRNALIIVTLIIRGEPLVTCGGYWSHEFEINHLRRSHREFHLKGSPE